MKAIFVDQDPQTIARVYGEKQIEAMKRVMELDEKVYTSVEELRSAALSDVEVIFSTWGMLPMKTEEIRETLPGAKALFYAAGSVQSFARPFIGAGVRVFSAWQANGVSVAQYTVSQILLAAKGYFRVQQAVREGGRRAACEEASHYIGAYGIRIGLLGCGAIGTQVARALKDTDCEVWAFDPFLPPERAEELGVRLTEMDDIFANCEIISNHLANLPETVGIIKRKHLLSMQPYATFINTGRGPQLNEQDLYDALTLDPTRTALLDVMTDEQNSDDKPLTHLPNCFVTPHIAGTSGREVHRMADYMLKCFRDYAAGLNPQYEVSMKMLETMA